MCNQKNTVIPLTRNDFETIAQIVEKALKPLITDVQILKSDVQVLKSDAADLKTDLKCVKDDLKLMKADLKVLAALNQLDEIKKRQKAEGSVWSSRRLKAFE